MTTMTRLLAVLAWAIATPALAVDLVYPPGVRIGVVPIEGLIRAKAFIGLESADQTVKVLMTELPAAAFGEVDTAFKTNPAGMGGLKPETIETTAGKAYYTAETAKVGNDSVRRYSMIVPGGTFSGYVAVQVPETGPAAYSEDAVKRMLMTTAVRKDVPVEEHLAQMPFKVTELGGFKTVRTLAPGAALLLADGAENSGIEKAPYMILGVIGSVPEKPEDRGRFAQQAAAQIPGLRDGRITMSEPVRIDGMPGFETRIDAVNLKDETPVTLVQWLRFGGPNAALRIVASAPRGDNWTAAFTRFRAVRDGLQTRQ